MPPTGSASKKKGDTEKSGQKLHTGMLHYSRVPLVVTGSSKRLGKNHKVRSRRIYAALHE
jgi:hypothetical protein